MPLVTHPGVTFEYILSTDKKQPAGKRPAFIFRYVSTLEWQQLSKLSDAFDTQTDSGKVINLAYQIINRVLVGWKHMVKPDGTKISFDLKRLPSMLTLGEATELMMAAVSQQPTLDDKKKFDLPSDSSTAASAKPVRGRKRAKINRRQPNRSK